MNKKWTILLISVPLLAINLLVVFNSNQISVTAILSLTMLMLFTVPFFISSLIAILFRFKSEKKENTSSGVLMKTLIVYAILIFFLFALNDIISFLKYL